MEETVYDELASLDPQFIAVIEDRSIGLKGYIVIDRTINEHACGGLRIVPGLSLDELKGLARSMTLKYGFNEMDQGGAKAGIVGDYTLSEDEKRVLIRRFGEIAAPLLKTGYYFTGSDINTTQEEIIDLMDHLEIPVPSRRRVTGKRGGMYTAMSVMVATEAAASFKNLDLRDSTIAIEGFGAVGSSYARLMEEKWGARIVAVSTIAGAIYNENGLDVGLLNELRKTYRGDFLNQYKDADRIDHHTLLELEVDILSPCARHFSIHDTNAPMIKAPVVCPGANIPVTAAAEKILFARNILSIPAFIANSGGVLGNKMEMLRLNDDFILEFMRRRNIPKILRLMDESMRLQEPMIRLAEEQAMGAFRKMKRTEKKNIIARIISFLGKRIVNRGLLPAFMLRGIGKYFYYRIQPEPADPL